MPGPCGRVATPPGPGISGTHHEGRPMSKYRTASPMTGEVIREYPTMHEEEVDQVLDRARQAYLTWATADVQERTKVLALTAYLYRQHQEELAALMTLEMGKPIAQARGEIDLAGAIFEYYATEGPRLIADERLDIAGNGEAIVRTAPIGPLLGIMPWNYPHYQAARFIAPNLLLGNTVVLKHAANCPQQALRIEALLVDGGAPEGVYTNVFATNEQVARMIAGPIIQGVSLTGSERAGIAVGELAGRHLKKCVLELGGSDPLIVLGDADIPKAVRAAAAGRFGNAGQACTSSKRIHRRNRCLGRVSRRIRGGGQILASRRPDQRRDPAGADGLAGGAGRPRCPGRRRHRQGRHRSPRR